MLPGSLLEAARARWACLALAATLALSPAAALAAKWKQCPSHVGYHPSALGAAGAPFIHPGHELGLFLTERVVTMTGGFSTAPGGNRVQVTLASLFGDPVVLPPTTATAISPDVLYFTFPDTRVLLGRVLAGPAEVLVTTGGRTTAHILPGDLVALPPSADVGGLLGGSAEEPAFATLDTRGALWIPVQFSAFGPMPKDMMNCPMTVIPITAFAVGLRVRTAPAEVIGPLPSYPPLRALRRIDLFLGDFIVNGWNSYGMDIGRLPVFRIPRGWGIQVCGINDAVDLVLRARGFRRWAMPWSPFATWMPNSQPLAVSLEDLSTDPEVAAMGLDAFGEECALR
jgi:hypothetical protein